ncbi:MAG TPA: YdcF family protein [Patescibacteria group bacterium]|nr:YdcF family protein [Patescibacteria group bacterium]
MTRPLGRLGIAAVLGSIVAFGWIAFRISDTGARDDHRPADAIVVLGAAQYDGRPSAILQARLDHAIELFEQGVAPWFLVTGGKAAGDRTTEAATARAYAIAHGVPASSILFEDGGRTTHESLQGVAKVLAARNLGSAIFVSDRTHMLRVLRIAADLGIDGRGSPTTTSPTDLVLAHRVEATVRELGALALYFVGAEIR